MNKVLITGADGLIGSRLADWIISNHPEYNVIGIDNLSGGYAENVNPDVTFINMDLTLEPTKLASIFETHKPDYVFHFLRKGFATQLENAGVPHNVAARLMGHELSDMTPGGYSDGLMFERLKEVITKVEYSKQYK